MSGDGIPGSGAFGVASPQTEVGRARTALGHRAAAALRAPLRGDARAAEEVTLSQLGSELPQGGELTCGLDALGDHLKLERACEVDDHRDEAGLAAPSRQPVHEWLGDLQAVERQRMKVAERRVPRAEVVERNPDAHVAE